MLPVANDLMHLQSNTKLPFVSGVYRDGAGRGGFKTFRESIGV